MATVVPALADRALPSTASVPETVAESAIAPFAVAEQVQANDAVLLPARSCEAGVGPERICAPPVPDEMASDGSSPFTPTPPLSVTARVTVNVSLRKAPAGADSEATNTEGVRTAIAGEATDAADKATPEFESAPPAPAERVSESGGVPPAGNVQENTTVLPPGTSTGACAGDALRLALPAGAGTRGGVGVRAASRARPPPPVPA